MKAHATYECDVCARVYDTAEKAALCEGQPKPELLARVGDIVTVRAGFGWHDGDRAWISNPDVVPKIQGGPPCPNGSGNCFGTCCTWSFYYVVTALDLGEGQSHSGYWLKDRETGVFLHRPIYHLATLAMTGRQGYGSGWTSWPGHYKPVRVETPPAAVVESSKALIGRRAASLI